jgi:hypothetical protein
MKSKGVSGTSGTLAQEVVNGYAEKHRGLLLPTPRVGGQEGYESIKNRKGHKCAMSYLETVVDYICHQSKQDADDGETSRLSPLFTEEMMGFPLMWTALPFLSENGGETV